MKIQKSQLKALIKECLVEILAEGLGSNLTEAVVAAPRGPRNRDAEPLPGQQFAPRGYADPNAGRRRALDETRFVPQQRQAPPPPPVQAAVSNLTRDPIMAAIFADTAQTTLVEQNNGVAGVAGGDRAAQAAARVDPTQLFSETQIDKWNEAAFKPVRPGGGLLGPSLPPDFLNDLLKGE